MRITILVSGSRGDVQPFAALGQGLARVGHAVTVATNRPFAPLVEALGLGFAPLEGDPQAILEANREKLTANQSLVGLLGLVRELVAVLGPLVERLNADAWAATADAEALIYSSVLTLIGPNIVEARHIPGVMAEVQPLWVPTRAFPLGAAPFVPLPGPLRALYHRATFAGFHQFYRPVWNRYVGPWRRGLGLPPLSITRYVRRLQRGRTLVLHGWSRHVLPIPPDWGPNNHVTGYWFPAQIPDAAPPPALLRFLAAGPPPVYVGFGSMSGPDSAALTRLVVAALGRTGLRGVLGTGWGGLSAADLPETVCAVQSVPHDWLFPQMAAVVHHGGAGTTASGLRAGVPTIIVPFLGADQNFWGQRVTALGVGLGPRPSRQLTVDWLAAALARVTRDAELRRRAARLGTQIRAEDGVGAAVAAFTRHLAAR